MKLRPIVTAVTFHIPISNVMAQALMKSTAQRADEARTWGSDDLWIRQGWSLPQVHKAYVYRRNPSTSLSPHKMSMACRLPGGSVTLTTIQDRSAKYLL